MSDDVRRRLEALGEVAAPEVRADFADQLEARLRSIADLGAAPAGPPPGRRVARRLAVAAVAAAMIVAVVGIGLARRDRDVTLELSASGDVVVELPDGRTVAGADGLDLVDGAVIRVGDAGSARVGEVDLGPGDVAVVVGDAVQVDHGEVAAPTTTTPPATTLARTPVTTTTAPGATTTLPPPSTTTGRDAPPATRPPEPPSTTTVRDATPPTRPPEPTTTVAPAAPRVEIEARARSPVRIAVRWEGAPDVAVHRLIATRSSDGAAPDPVWPGGDVVAETGGPPAEPVIVEVPRGTRQVRLLVVVTGPGGAEVGRSAVAVVDLGA